MALYRPRELVRLGAVLVVYLARLGFMQSAPLM